MNSTKQRIQAEKQMKATLRKAHKLVSTLQAHISVKSVTESIHKSTAKMDVKGIMEEVQSKFDKNLDRSLAVVDTINFIRTEVQKKNSLVVDGDSIDLLLTRKAHVESQMKVLAQFASLDNKPDNEKELSKLTQKILDMNENTGNSLYGRSDTNHTFTSISEETFVSSNAKYVELKEEQETISDKLAYLNNKLEIELSEAQHKFLKSLQVA